MAYRPTVGNEAGSIMASGALKGATALAEGIEKAKQNQAEVAGADAAWEFMQRTNPELFKAAAGETPEAVSKFMARFSSAALPAKKAMLGTIVAQALTPMDRAKKGLIEAQTAESAARTKSYGDGAGVTAPTPGVGKKWRSKFGGTSGGEVGLPEEAAVGAPALTNGGTPGAAGPLIPPVMSGPPDLGLPPVGAAPGGGAFRFSAPPRLGL